MKRKVILGLFLVAIIVFATSGIKVSNNAEISNPDPTVTHAEIVNPDPTATQVVF